MWFRNSILNKHLSDRKIYKVIGHHSWKYTKSIVKHLFLLALLFLVYELLWAYFEWRYFDYVLGVLWLLLYVVFMVSILDIYLDCIVVTNKWLVLFKREGFLRQNTEHIQRDAAQSVYDEQNWILDIVSGKWNLKIKRQDEIYTFYEVANPSSVTNYIVQIRDSINSQENYVEPDKFDVLVETLWEVILDYVKNNKTST